MTQITDKWSKTSDKRPHRHLITPRGGEWIRPTMTPSSTWFLGPTWVRSPPPSLASRLVLPFMHGSRNVTNRHTQMDRILCNACRSLKIAAF